MRGCKLILALVVLFTAGCTFSRTVVNPEERNADIEWIQVGETTWIEVLRKMGGSISNEPAQVDVANRGLRFSVTETKAVSFAAILPISLPFAWYDARRTRDIYIEFDDAGLVREVWESRDHCAWRPFQKPAPTPQVVLVKSAQGAGS